MRVTHSKSSRDAKNYYAFSDYYDSGPSQLKGAWFGRGAELLGLSGEVEKGLFDRLIDNRFPFEDARLTQRDRADRRVGTDLTFSVPKSLSILWAYTQDDQILEMVQQAAHETIADLEVDAQTRVNHERGRMTLEKTGNLVGASWLHTTSRPVEGYPDPNLHVHCFVVNATNTGDRWTAVDLSAIVRDSGYYEAIFQSRLAEKVQSIGYPVERSERDFEIAGVSRSTIDKFSRRTQLIEKAAEEQGITDAAAKGRLGAQTRDKKQTNRVPVDELPNFWRELLNNSETNSLAEIAAKPGLPPKEKNVEVAAVDFSTKHNFELQSVVRERQIIRDALLHGIGQASVDDVMREVNSRDWVREGEDENALLSTREVLAEEQALIAFARSGRGRCSPLAPDHQINRQWLGPDQQSAVHGLLESTDRLQLLRGVAGSGKTSMMSEAIEAILQAGMKVAILAPTAEATHGVLREKEGFDAQTVASFIKTKEQQDAVRGGVLWVDEAGLVGTQDLATLTRIAADSNARVILSGDVHQHEPVARGIPLRLLESDAGIKPHEVKTIRRQEGGYRDAVALLSRGQVDAGLTRLEELGFVKEIKDDTERNQQLARDYADSIESKKSSLVVAPSHAERHVVTDAIRNELKARGLITGGETSLLTLTSKRLSEAQRGEAFNYAPGDVVEFVTKGKGGFKAGDRLRVESVRDGKVIAKSKEGEITVPLESPKSFDVYRPDTAKFAKGDLIRITKNRRPDRHSTAKRLNNGSLLTLQGFTKSGDLKLSNGQTVPAGWGHIDHGVTVTSYGSQGKTFDRVFVAQSNLSFPASSPEQAYVSTSRGRETVTIYTNSRAELRTAMSQHRPSMNASELKPNEPQSVEPSRLSISDQFAHIRDQAKRFAATQLQRFRRWAASHEPQYAR